MREELTGTFFTMDLDPRAARARAGAVGAQRRAAPAMAASPRDRSRGTRAVRALERRRAGEFARRGVQRRVEGRLAAVRRPGRPGRGDDGAVPRVVRALGAARARRCARCACRRAAAGRSWPPARRDRLVDRARPRRAGCAPGALRRGAAADAGRAGARRARAWITSICGTAMDSPRACRNSGKKRASRPHEERPRDNAW